MGKTILITGATGTIMAPLCALLLQRGHTVVALVRGENPEERLYSAMNIAEGGSSERLYVVHGDITQDLGGITSQNIALWRGKIDAVLHGAARIGFIETPDQETYRTNVLGTSYMLKLAQKLGIPEFHYVSTIEVAGDSPKLLETDRRNGQRFHNPYEDTKSQAEELVFNWSYGRCSVYRLPIVVGDSRTGRIGSIATGYYGFFRPFWRLGQQLSARRAESKTELWEKGIAINQDGTIHIPIHIPCSPVGPLQMVPIDWISQTMANLVEIPTTGKAFQLTHPEPPRVQWVIDTSLAHLGFRGFTSGVSSNNTPSVARLLQIIQAGIQRGIKPYAPYVNLDWQCVPNHVLVDTLGKRYTPPPSIDEQLLYTLLRHAVRRRFE